LANSFFFLLRPVLVFRTVVEVGLGVQRSREQASESITTVDNGLENFTQETISLSLLVFVNPSHTEGDCGDPPRRHWSPNQESGEAESVTRGEITYILIE
jgi:hypothetical protein